jgi:hypothetical protein
MFERIIVRAGLEQWPQLFQAMRRNCETDWAKNYPQHAVSTWLGHDIDLPTLQVTEDLYEQVTSTANSPGESGNI